MGRDDELNKALEQQAIWEVIDYLEGRLEELEELMEDGPLSKELMDEYRDKDNYTVCRALPPAVHHSSPGQQTFQMNGGLC